MEQDGIWHERHVVAYQHTDRFGRMSLEALQAILASAAGGHAYAHGVSTDLLQTKGKLWVLNHMEIDLHVPLQYRDVLLIRTWVESMQGARSYRRFDLHNPDGQLLASALSVWALLDLETMRPVRVESLGMQFPAYAEPPAWGGML